MIKFKSLIFLFFILTECQSKGLLTIEGSINNSLEEVSAAEYIINQQIIWVIEDSGNDNHLYGLNKSGKITKDITIENAENIDWEDLTSDNDGNIYIGDFGNNSKKRKTFRILKINHEDLTKNTAKAKVIEFRLPEKQDSKDFEAFFLFNDSFYIFSKETKKFIVLKVPNEVGTHEAIIKSDFNLEGKHNKITSADISNDGKTVVLLNHDKLWKLTHFNDDDFFSGTIQKRLFKHDSQKEGVCFIKNSIIILTDERNASLGGNIYSFSIN